jgi:hypothetical protein
MKSSSVKIEVHTLVIQPFPQRGCNCLCERGRKVHKEEINNPTSATNRSAVMELRRMWHTLQVTPMKWQEACGNAERLTGRQTDETNSDRLVRKCLADKCLYFSLSIRICNLHNEEFVLRHMLLETQFPVFTSNSAGSCSTLHNVSHLYLEGKCSINAVTWRAYIMCCLEINVNLNQNNIAIGFHYLHVSEPLVAHQRQRPTEDQSHKDGCTMKVVWRKWHVFCLLGLNAAENTG